MHTHILPTIIILLAAAAKHKAHIISHANTINNKQKRPWQSRDNFCIFGLGNSAKVQAFGISGELYQKYMFIALVFTSSRRCDVVEASI